jgi:hypothetical protein
MKKSAIAGGLVTLLLACLPSNSMAQKRQYIKGNVHEVKYSEATEKDFPKYKLEEQCLFGNCYTFWNYNTKQGKSREEELNFLVSNKNEETISFQEGQQVKIDAPMYVPTKVGDNINVTELSIKRTSIEKLRKRAKERNSAGFSVDITDRDLEFKLPQIKVNGVEYIVLQEMIDNSQERNDIPLYLIPRTKGTVISFPEESFIEENGYEVQAIITCDKKGGIFQPVPFSQSGKLYLYKSTETPSEIPEQNKGSNKKTDYMKYREELEKNQSKKNKLEKQTQPQNIPTKKEEAEEYEIKTGDTFYNIADKIYGTGKDADLIQRANPEVDASKLKVGQKIKILKK